MKDFFKKPLFSPDTNGSGGPDKKERAEAKESKKESKEQEKRFLSDFFVLCDLYEELKGWQKNDFDRLKTDLAREWKKQKKTNRRFEPDPQLKQTLEQIEAEYQQVFNELDSLLKNCFSTPRLQDIFRCHLGQEIPSLEQARQYRQKLLEPLYEEFQSQNPFAKQITDSPTEHSSQADIETYQQAIKQLTRNNPQWTEILEKLEYLPGSHHPLLNSYFQAETKEEKSQFEKARILLNLGKPLIDSKYIFEEVNISKIEIDFEEANLRALANKLKEAKPLVEKFRKEWADILQLKKEKGAKERKSAGAIDTLTALTFEGKEVILLDLKKEREYWSNFYSENGVDWVSLPESIKITPDQAKKMTRLITEYGFNKLIIIPDNLVDEPTIENDASGKPISIKNDKYLKLHQLMSKGYHDTYQSGDYKQDGSFQGSEDKTANLRLILTKDIQNLGDDPLFKATKDKSIEELEKDELTKFTGLSESAYLIYQREYFNHTGKHLDERGWTCLPESTRPLSGRVTSACWGPGHGRLTFYSDDRGGRHDELGCRLAGSFEIEI